MFENTVLSVCTYYYLAFFTTTTTTRVVILIHRDNPMVETDNHEHFDLIMILVGSEPHQVNNQTNLTQKFITMTLPLTST